MAFLFGPKENNNCVHGLSFLYRVKDKPIYFMDNHGAALWCWAQEVKAGIKYNLIHIDRHYDTRDGGGLVEEKLKNINSSSIEELTIEEFINRKMTTNGLSQHIMRYDDFLLLFIKKYKDSVGKVILANINSIENPGDDPSQTCNDIEIEKCESKEQLLNSLEIISSLENLIVDIDLDYFTDGENITFTKEEVNQVLNIVKSKNIKCITIASSPNHTFLDNSKSLEFCNRVYKYILVKYKSGK